MGMRAGTSPWERSSSHWERSEGDDAHIGLVILVVLLGALIFGGFVYWRTNVGLQPPNIDALTGRSDPVVQRPGSGYQSGSQSPAQAQPEQAQQANPAEAAPAVVQATATPAAAVAHVAHTDGVGVVLRASPRDKDWTPRGFMDGTEVRVLERQGADWVRVRGPNNQEGWIPARYLDQ
jgi:Bacterial SH3 domain